MAADGSVEMKCTPESEAQVFLDTYKVCIGAFTRLKDMKCPAIVAAGTEAVDQAPEAEAPYIASQIPKGRFEK